MNTRMRWLIVILVIVLLVFALVIRYVHPRSYFNELVNEVSTISTTTPKTATSTAAATTTVSKPKPTTPSGITGVVTLGPTCPVMYNPPQPGCADRPYTTTVVVFRKADPVHAVAFGQSNQSGIFSFALPPGDYMLGAGDSDLPRCDHPEVIVSSGFTETQIMCDTGIR